MRILIAEDDKASRIFIKKILSRYGECDVAADGLETIDAFVKAHEEENPYQLICLDIMMPRLDGLKALQAIRDIEKQNAILVENRVKIIMLTALNDRNTIASAYEAGCEAYEWKPIEVDKLILALRKIGLIE